jgi:hypothetical protein
VIRPGDKVWIIPNLGGEPHPAVVIRVSSDGGHALVLSGTGTGPRDLPYELVDPSRRLSKPLRLTKPTYFYQSAVHVRPVDDLKPDEPAARCPLPLWEKLQVLALAGARDKLSRNDFRAWWPDADPLA